MANQEAIRLQQANSKNKPNAWRRWGPYLSERQWGTVREDYSPDGNAWDYFSHDQARSRAYRWGEDGLAGLSDENQQLCFSLGLWNGNDPILKERLFGLTNDEGNHGEDVKEYYFYLDNTPTHSYMKWLYKYPQAAFPYTELTQENKRRKQWDKSAPEYELIDTGVFNNNRYYDITVEYAKASPDDILIRINVSNRGPEKETLHLLPTLLFRNTWTWFKDVPKPLLQGTLEDSASRCSSILATFGKENRRDTTAQMKLYCDENKHLLFTENETNSKKIWSDDSGSKYPKDGINDHIIHGAESVNPNLTGTKASAVYEIELDAGETKEVLLRLSSDLKMSNPFGKLYNKVFSDRTKEADDFYEDITSNIKTKDRRRISRQAYAGMLWSKQYYHFVIKDWLTGDPTQPSPPAQRERNKTWTHLYANNILSMPDAWEYPWFASWDLCFQSVVFARIDLSFAKKQLLILAREWFMSPSGDIPANEWDFDDANPPLHAWAALRILDIEKQTTGNVDLEFAQSILQYCLMYFTWWANKKDLNGDDLFGGGFLGLDNISVFNRSNLEALEKHLGYGLQLCQSDGTSWMGHFCLNLTELALKLTSKNKEYTRIASKFIQHFANIANTIDGVSQPTSGDIKLWNEEDGFFYDVLKLKKQTGKAEYIPLKIRSIVGIVALFPALTINMEQLDDSTNDEMNERITWFLKNNPEIFSKIHHQNKRKHLLSFVNPDRLKRILARVFSEDEFLSTYGIRSISRQYLDKPYSVDIHGHELREKYEPAESSSDDFGGNSNWRGPIWFPINFLFLETLRKYHSYLGNDFLIEFPTHSGKRFTLEAIAANLSDRLIAIFEQKNGKRPVYGGTTIFQNDPHWKDHLLFYEYFHGDNGAGIGASHQTGWTGLVAELLCTPDKHSEKSTRNERQKIKYPYDKKRRNVTNKSTA